MIKLVDCKTSQGNLGVLNLFKNDQIDDIDGEDPIISEGSLVKIRFWPKPRLSDYDFKEYLALKQNKVGIKLGIDQGFESFFRIHRILCPATAANGSFDYGSILPVTMSGSYFHKTETGSLTLVESIPVMTTKTNVYASFKTNNNLLR